jgi:hypothetical protein
MALLTKAQVRTAVRQAIDDPDATLWSDGNLDILITLVEDTMFQAILDTWPFALSLAESKTTSAAGAIDTSLGVTLTNRFYRVQKVVRDSDGVELQPRLFTEAVPQSTTYYMLGNLIITPVLAGAVTTTYSFLPLKFSELALETTALPNYPDGHEAALIYLAAAWALAKGDRESIQQIARIADQAVEALLTHIARRYPVAVQPRVTAVKAQIMRNALGGQVQ